MGISTIIFAPVVQEVRRVVADIARNWRLETPDGVPQIAAIACPKAG
jgi:hypothetical protein